MGSIKKAPWTFSWVPVEFMDFVRRAVGIRTFVETGTEFGKTSEWAASKFDDVYTVEASPERYAEARKRLDKYLNVATTFGESHTLLRDISQMHREPILFWLDAHWHLDDSYYGRDEVHPLMQEIYLCRARKGLNFFFIDDMRFIVYPFTRPGSTQVWPSISDLIHALDGYEIAIYNDVLVAFPPGYGDLLMEWKMAIKGTSLDIL